jgi:hypothetical protein
MNAASFGGYFILATFALLALGRFAKSLAGVLADKRRPRSS